MNLSTLKIGTLYTKTDGTREAFDLELPADFFEPDLLLTKPLQVQGKLMRVEEGIMVLIDELKTEMQALCAHCGKDLTVPLQVQDSEWLFYEQKPLEYDDENEFLFLDRHQMQLDLKEALRQDLILAMPVVFRCAKPCKSKLKLEESLPEKREDKGVKALAGLKNLLKS